MAKRRIGSAGFTLIEILVVVAVSAVLIASMFAGFSGSNGTAGLTKAGADVKQAIRQAQIEAAAGVGGTSKTYQVCATRILFTPDSANYQIDRYQLNGVGNCSNSNFTNLWSDTSAYTLPGGVTFPSAGFTASSGSWSNWGSTGMKGILMLAPVVNPTVSGSYPALSSFMGNTDTTTYDPNDPTYRNIYSLKVTNSNGQYQKISYDASNNAVTSCTSDVAGC